LKERELLIGDTPGNKTAGINLGIRTHLSIDYEYGSPELYPDNTPTEDEHDSIRASTRGKTGQASVRWRLTAKRSRRKDHFFHGLSEHLV
jgi:putative transposase